jgi:5,10-methylene-tetrahydrofolate dehydrogenase/methenyl tetrahydrofolate cyclohydrolase
MRAWKNFKSNHEILQLKAAIHKVNSETNVTNILIRCPNIRGVAESTIVDVRDNTFDINAN